MNLNEIAHDMHETARKREEHGGIKADSKSLFKHMATEVIEAEEAFFFYLSIDDLFDNEIPKEAGDIKRDHRQALAGELADVIACALIIAANENIDIENALESCLYKNQLRAMRQGDKL